MTRRPKTAVVSFPGTNCDQDVVQWLTEKNHDVQFVSGLDRQDFLNCAAVVLPGGFSFGDYLRSGALAARSPAMKDVVAYANRGGHVLGICNGFQILTEIGLLPGALLRNVRGRFIDRWVSLKIEQKNSMLAGEVGTQIKLPIAHGDGRFIETEDNVKKLFDRGQVWLTYAGANPNGSVADIAGIQNEKKNVAALMPHPERAAHRWMGSGDGQAFLRQKAFA